MAGYYCKYLILLFALELHLANRVSSFTAEVKMESCYDTTRRGYGFRVTNGPIVSRVNCSMFFEAPETNLFIAVRLNKINLARIGQSCPTFTVFIFTGWRTEPVANEWIGSEVTVPADPLPLMSCNCTNYLKQCPDMRFDETKGPAQKIMLTYNPDDPQRTIKREDAFDVTLSSFHRGSSFVCPANYFSCWHYRYRCVPNTLVCDGFDNCYDNSDEFSYSCSGRIANMTLPVFVIFVLGCTIGFCILVFAVVLIIKRQLRKRRLERNEWGEVVKRSSHQAFAVPVSDPLEQQQQEMLPPRSGMPMGFDGQ